VIGKSFPRQGVSQHHPGDRSAELRDETSRCVSDAGATREEISHE
jgi:hypothetical protein